MINKHVPIPKRLFFIWLGNNHPSFMDFSVDSYAKNNPDFNIIKIIRDQNQMKRLLEHGKPELEYDEDIIESIKGINSIESKYFECSQNQKKIYKTDKVSNQLISDILRLVLINNHGGIYVDCDTYSMKPLYDILDMENFVVKRHRMNGSMWFDNYFIGSNGEKDILDPINGNDTVNPIVQTEYGWWKNVSFQKNRISFMKCNNNTIIHDEKFHIQHYFLGRFNCK